jgi:arylsulfatase A-like enzyme
MKHALISFVLLFAFLPAQAAPQQSSTKPVKRNVIIFVADGMRHGSVNAQDTPALWRVRTEGVHFENSYSLFPTFTTANASAIATGHRLGDTGDFSNALYTGYRIFDTGNFNRSAGTILPFIENDEILADLNSHYDGSYLNESTLLEAARKSGFNTVAIGKLGATAIQDVAVITPQDKKFPQPPTIIVDDATAYKPWDSVKVPKSIPLPQALLDRLIELGIPLEAPARNNGFANNSPYSNEFVGNSQTPGTLSPNTVQQQWMLDVTTRAVLPMFAASDKPFVMVFWSRDPDASQHDEGDSFQRLEPGINGPTSIAGIRNADHCLGSLLAWLDEHPDVKANTDIFVTSDHGFATVSRREIDRLKTPTTSPTAQHVYLNASGKVDTTKGFLPGGFLAIDLARELKTRLWDPDAPAPAGTGNAYREVPVKAASDSSEQWERPSHGNGLLGEKVSKLDGSDAMAIVAANGGTDLIYVPIKNRQAVERIVKALLKFDYVGNIFVDDQYGRLPGTLPLSDIDLVGSAVTPRPAILVGFKNFYLTPGEVMEGIQVSDTGLQEGQGNHGGFGRECTYNNMAAIGPDFKQQSVDPAPVGNADIVPTLAHILGIVMPSTGKLGGRVITEALKGNPDANAPPMTWLVSDPAPENSLRTVLFEQEYGGQKYFYSACMTSSKAIKPGMCEQQ